VKKAISERVGVSIGHGVRHKALSKSSDDGEVLGWFIVDVWRIEF
jgi:hypothetical protein